jgi:hypothetical protein
MALLARRDQRIAAEPIADAQILPATAAMW